MNTFEKICLLVFTILIGNTLFFNFIKIPSWVKYKDYDYFSISDFDDGIWYVAYGNYPARHNEHGVYLFSVTSRFKRLAYIKANLHLLFHNDIKIYKDTF